MALLEVQISLGSARRKKASPITKLQTHKIIAAMAGDGPELHAHRMRTRRAWVTFQSRNGGRGGRTSVSQNRLAKSLDNNKMFPT